MPATVMSVRAVKLGGTSKFVKKKPTQMSLIYKRSRRMIIVMNAMMDSQLLILEMRYGVRKMIMKKMTSMGLVIVKNMRGVMPNKRWGMTMTSLMMLSRETLTIIGI